MGNEETPEFRAFVDAFLWKLAVIYQVPEKLLNSKVRMSKARDSRMRKYWDGVEKIRAGEAIR